MVAEAGAQLSLDFYTSAPFPLCSRALSRCTFRALLSLRAHIIALAVIPGASKAADGRRNLILLLLGFRYILYDKFPPEYQSSVTVAARRTIAVLPKANHYTVGTLWCVT